MKTPMCSLAAILIVTLSSAAVGIPDDGVITGTVAPAKEGDFAINNGSGTFDFIAAGDAQTPKIGEKVRVHYYHCGSGRKGFHHCADKIEKLRK
jgi:hypothetical protein